MPGAEGPRGGPLTDASCREIHDLNREFQTALIRCIQGDSKLIEPALDSMAVCRCQKRIGDHAKNIYEAVSGSCEACDVRHTRVPAEVS